MGFVWDSNGFAYLWNYQKFAKMKLSFLFSIASHVANFVIIIYFISFLINIETIRISDILISFIGLFASLIANIVSVVEENK